jgi:hypothetical protein
MTIHAILLAFVIATLLGALFHLIRGGSVRRLGIFILSANLSFFLGHVLSEIIHWQLLRLGSINLFPAMLATILGLILTTALAGEETPRSPPSKRTRRRR